MRDHLAHRYFDTAHAILQSTVDDDLPELERAVHALIATLPDENPPGGPRPMGTARAATPGVTAMHPRFSAWDSPALRSLCKQHQATIRVWIADLATTVTVSPQRDAGVRSSSRLKEYRR
jgi:hypothetical protein